MDEDQQYIVGKKCVKCPEPAKYAGVDVKKAVYCKPCFITMVKNKFRSALSKRKIFKEENDRRCIIIFNGDTASCFLLHQIIDTLQQPVYKQLIISPIIVLLINSVMEESLRLIMDKFFTIQKLLPSVPWIIVHVAAGLEKTPIEIVSKCQGENQIPRYIKFLEKCATSTAKEEFRRLLKEKTCLLIANSLGARKIMLPEDGDSLGRLALAQLCLGRGGKLNDMTSVLEKRPSGVSFIRPLRDVNSKEISIVSHLEGYENAAIRAMENVNFTSGSIQEATSVFVDNLLSEGFKATITTVLSTASKLHSVSSERACILCETDSASYDCDICCCCQSFLSEVKEPQDLKEALLF